jgi:hypothetical protein
MEKQEVTKEDGRIVYFYTFDDETEAESAEETRE